MSGCLEPAEKQPAEKISEQGTLLLVDDDIYVLHALKRILREHPFRVLTAVSAFQALSLLARERVEMMLLDYWMPGRDGLWLARIVKTEWPEVVQVMLTGCVELGVVREAMRRGEIYRYLVKPWDKDELLKTIHEARIIAQNRKRAAADGGVVTSAGPPGAILESFSDGRASPEWITSDSDPAWVTRMIEISRAVERRDPCTLGHSSRVAMLSLWMSERLGMSPSDQMDLKLGALLHDVGKISIPDAILFKPAALLPDETASIQSHTINGEQMLQSQGAPAPVAAVARFHHENYDGSGYPDGRAREESPLSARIVRLADSFDAMHHRRPYREGIPLPLIEERFRDLAGSQFDPALVPDFLELIQAKVQEIYR